MKTKKRIWLSIVVLSTLLICGFSRNIEKANPEERVIYEVIDLNNPRQSNYSNNSNASDAGLYSLLASNKDAAFQKYDGHSVVIIGVLVEKGKKNKDCIVRSTDKINSVSIDCSSLTKKLETLQVNDRVIVYGKLKMGSKRKVEISLDAVDIFSTSLFKLDFDYCFFDGNEMKTYSKEDSMEKDIPKSSIKYSIPNSWGRVERGYDSNAKENVLFSNFGRYYMLNKLDKNQSTQCFCIFNIEYKTYLKYDTDWKERSAIERAVISNICPDEDLGLTSIDHYKMFTQVYKTTYGKEFDHFMSSFGDYDVEFFFVPVRDNTGKEVSLCVMMYIYDDKYNYSDDVLYVLRTLDIGVAQ